MLPIIGMSPGNSFFKNREVAYLLREAIKRYNKAVVMVADIPAISTYQAMGYNPSKARSKAVLKGNNLKNRTRQVIQDLGIEDERIIIVDWDNEVKEHSDYLQKFAEVRALFDENDVFNAAVRETSEQVLKHHGKEYCSEDVDSAVHYLLSEIAFLEFAPKYFGEDQVCYLYHKNRKVYEDYIAGIFDGVTRHYLDFKLLEVPYETYLTLTERPNDRYELIRGRGSIKCTYSPYFDYFQHDGDGFRGLFYDKIQEVAKKRRLDLEFVEQSGYGVLENRLNSGFADVFCSPVRPTKSRRLSLFFSKSLFPSNIYAYLRADSLFATKTFEALQRETELRIAVKEDDIHHDLANIFFPQARLVWVPQLSRIEEVIQFVLDNRADMTFWEDGLTTKYLEQIGVAVESLVAKGRGDKPVATYENCFALPRGEFELKRIIDESLDM